MRRSDHLVTTSSSKIRNGLEFANLSVVIGSIPSSSQTMKIVSNCWPSYGASKERECLSPIQLGIWGIGKLRR